VNGSKHPYFRSIQNQAWILLFALFSIIPWLTDNIFYLNFLLTIFFSIAITNIWSFFGISGYINLGQTAFIGLGGYISILLLINYQLSPFITFPFAGFIAAIIAIVVGGASLKVGIRGDYFLVVTLALVFIIRNIFSALPETGGGVGLLVPPNLFLRPVYPFPNTIAVYYITFLFAAFLSTLLLRSFLKSRLGFSLRAIAGDEDVAESVGVPTYRAKLMALTVSAFSAGSIGSLYAYYLSYIDPPIMFNLELSIFPVAASFVGGLVHPIGPLLGAIILQISTSIVSYFITGTSLGLAIYGFIILVVITFFPKGITGSLLTRFQKIGKQYSSA